MISGPLKSMLAMVTAIGFVSFLLIPCLCGTAAAAEIEEEPTGCCPFSQDSDPEETPDDQDPDHDCCSDCGTICVQGQGNGDLVGSEAVLSTERDDLEQAGPKLLWTPQILATLWLVDRLADVEIPSQPPAQHLSTDLIDRSDTYLKFETFLI
jgi:hypothetical protein